jgi:hypothetical protein
MMGSGVTPRVTRASSCSRAISPACRASSACKSPEASAGRDNAGRGDREISRPNLIRRGRAAVRRGPGSRTSSSASRAISLTRSHTAMQVWWLEMAQIAAASSPRTAVEARGAAWSVACDYGVTSSATIGAPCSTNHSNWASSSSAIGYVRRSCGKRRSRTSSAQRATAATARSPSSA